MFLLVTTTLAYAERPTASTIIPSSHPTGLQGGQFLFTPCASQTTYLINETGAVQHTWHSAYKPNLDSYLVENGSILLAIQSGNGGFQKIAWNGTVQWEYHYTRDTSFATHDVVPLPNGDVLMIMQEEKSFAQAVQAGRDPSDTGGVFIVNFLIQVHQTGRTSGDIVWEWHVWDHLIQDFNATKDNYGDISQHPELININFGEDFLGDWLHTNSVDYNPTFDQILLSVHNFDEVWIIDHSTTTEQAASHEGGQYNHGGDLLYRWGNPQAYDRGNDNNKILYFEHQSYWIKPGLPGAGNILVFNNGNNYPGGPLSTVDEFTPDVNNDTGEYTLPPGGTYGPEHPTWHYQLPADLYTDILGGVQRMLNGDTFICSGHNGVCIEVAPDQHIVWTYVNPYPSPSSDSLYRTQYIPPQPTPQVSIHGQLTWTKVKPGATLKGSFQLSNTGEADSLLNWTIDDASVTWGTWTFSPSSGTNLRPSQGPITINVTCIAPKDKNKQFLGSLTVQDINTISDNASVPISLLTPFLPPHHFPRFWQWFTFLTGLMQQFRNHTI